MKVNLINENFTENYTENLLRARGIIDIDKFLNPTIKEIESPTYLENIDDGCELLYHKLMFKPSILIVVDSDVDGYTSSAIIYQYIKTICPDCIVNYVIHGGKQHGLEDHIKKILNGDVHYDLIIEPDAGTNDFEYHENLKEIGTNVLVIDHHELDSSSKISDNVIIVNNQTSVAYSNKELTGAGVTYQFCKRFDQLYGYNIADNFIDLAALGIIGDMGGMNEIENRAIVMNGMRFPCKNLFLETLIRKQAYSITGNSYADDNLINQKLTPTSIAFYIVPLINAMVRSGGAEEKERMFEAFVSPNKMVISHKRGANGALEKVCIESARECTNAKSRQDKLKLQMSERLEAKIHKHGLLENKVLFVRLDDDDDFPPELNGLIAMQLAAKFKKPTIVARLNGEGFIRGSARGLNDCELTDFKQFLLDSGMFEYAQGHANAFGISIPNGTLDKFHKYANAALDHIDFGENVYDVNFKRQATSTDLENIIMDVGSHPDVWGQKMREPLIYVEDINLDPGEWQVIGSKKNTLKFTKNGVTYIKFFATDMIEEFSKYSSLKIHLIGKMAINEWAGNFTPQIMIENAEIMDNKFGF